MSIDAITSKIQPDHTSTPVGSDNSAPQNRQLFALQPSQVARVAGWLSHLIDPDQVVELRAIGVTDAAPIVFANGHTKAPTYTGTFRGTELEALARAGLEMSGCANLYLTSNPLQLQRFARQAPRLQRNSKAAEDKHVLSRNWLFLDIDRPKAFRKAAATAEQKERLLAFTYRVREYLATEGFSAPRILASGNGYYLRYRTEDVPFSLPLTDDDVVKRVLEHLADKFDDDDGEVDTSVFNPARIYRMPGTLNIKHKPVGGSGYPRCVLLDAPSNGNESVSVELLQDLARRAPNAERKVSVLVNSSPTRTNRAKTAKGSKIDGVERARRYLSTIPGAVSGQGGHNATYRAACKLVLGFDLSPDQAYLLFAEWNASCSPPWSEYELRRKLEQADKQTGERGRLINQEREQPPEPPIKTASEVADVQCGTPARKPTPYCSDCDNFTCGNIGPFGRCGRARASISNAEKTPLGIHARAESLAPSPDLLAIVGKTPRFRPCRYSTTKLREGCHENTLGTFDILKTSCGKCGACQEKRRHAEKLLHCGAALAVGTHVYQQESEEDWNAMRAKLDRIRKKVGREEPYPFSRCVQEDGRRFVVFAIDTDSELLPPELIPTASEQCAMLMAGAIDAIPYKLPKNTTRIQSNTAWKAAGGKVKKPKKETLYEDLGTVELHTGPDLDAVTEAALASDNVIEVVRSSLPSSRIEDRLIVRCAPDTEHEVFRTLCQGTLRELRTAAKERAERTLKRRSERARREQEEKSLRAEAGSLLRSLRAQYHEREHEAGLLVRLLLT